MADRCECGFDGYDVVIIGGGPGGLSAAVEAEASGLRYVLLEKNVLGNTMLERYPKGKSVEMDYHGVTAEFIGRMSFDKGIMSQEEFLPEFIAWADGIHYHLDEGVDQVMRDADGTFGVETWRGTYRTENAVIAIGQFGRPNTLPMWSDVAQYPTGLPKNLRGLVMFSLDDPAKYAGLDMLVIGGGDTAIETAVALKDSADVDISYRRDAFMLGKRLSQINYDAIHAAIGADEIASHMLTDLVEALPADPDASGNKTVDVTLKHRDGSLISRRYHRIFLCLGGTTPTGFLEQAGITVDGKNPRVDPATLESVDVPGLYVIGDLSGVGEKAIVTALKHGALVVERIRRG